MNTNPLETMEKNHFIITNKNFCRSVEVNTYEK